jgi:hypothetical protein
MVCTIEHMFEAGKLGAGGTDRLVGQFRWADPRQGATIGA